LSSLLRDLLCACDVMANNRMLPASKNFSFMCVS
jgi:hypothetical protein